MSEDRVQDYWDSGNLGENPGKEGATEEGDLYSAYKFSLNPQETPPLFTCRQNSKEPGGK